jgi:hypothetical protein
MPRNEALENLGHVYRSMTNLQGDYTCEEFRYVVKDGKNWFVLVWISDERVESVIRGTINECYLTIV